MKFYRESFVADQVCSLGCKHKVYYYEVVEVTRLEDSRKTIMYGTTPTTGIDSWYADSSGMIYYRQATWDGSDWPVDENGDAWMPRPIGEVKKDLDGNLLTY